MEDINIRFPDWEDKYQFGATYLASSVSFKMYTRIEIYLVKHLVYTKHSLEKDNLEPLLIELTDTIIHELIHYVGEISKANLEDCESKIEDTTKAMMFRNSLTPKWIVDISNKKLRRNKRKEGITNGRY